MTIDDHLNGWRRRFGANLSQPTRAARARRSRRAAAVLALAALTTLAQVGAIHAASAPAALPLRSGSAATLATPQPRTSLRPPITVPTPLPVVPGGSLTAPGLSPLQATASSVTVQWSDRSTNELGFKVFERDEVGRWRQVQQVPTRDVRGSGDTYTWVDTNTNLSGQCYMVTAYNANTAGSSAEECTVRPDPSRFPQLVRYGQEWSGLSDTNDGTGELFNIDNKQQLQYADGTFWHGVNLQWGNSSLWRVEAQGGPHLMKGQALALKVWGGGWLMYGNQTWGVDLQLSPTPVYEWYAIGRENDPSDSSWAGSGLEDGGGFALWNSSAQAYLLASYQTWGVSLNWSNQVGRSPSPPPPFTPLPVKSVQVFNCEDNQLGAEVVVKDQTTGSGYIDVGTAGWDGFNGQCEGSQPFTFFPQPGHQYTLYVTQNGLCDGYPGVNPEDPSPQDPACIDAGPTSFVGDANGDILPIYLRVGPGGPLFVKPGAEVSQGASGSRHKRRP